MKPKHPATVLIAHGSRIEAANEEVRRLATQITTKLETPVIAAFLELASPSRPLTLPYKTIPARSASCPIF